LIWDRPATLRRAGPGGVLVETGVQRTPDPAGGAFGKPGRAHLGHRVVPGFIGTGHHAQRPVPVPVEGIA